MTLIYQDEPIKEMTPKFSMEQEKIALKVSKSERDGADILTVSDCLNTLITTNLSGSALNSKRCIISPTIEDRGFLLTVRT